MSGERIEERIARLNTLSERLFGEPAEVEAAEAEDLLKTAGVDPEALKNSLYQRARERSETYSRTGKPLPSLFRKALEDLRPGEERKGDDSTVSRRARVAVARLLQEIRELPKQLCAGSAPAFTAAYRNRTELSSRDKAVLDQVAKELGEKAHKRWDRPTQHQEGRRAVERLGPVYARALLAELAQSHGGIHEIAAALGIDLLEVEADGFDGALIRANDVPLAEIVVRASIREAGRKNFTMAHELGHFVLPSHQRMSIACMASEIGNWADASRRTALEREADEFAAELLMPSSLVEPVSWGATPSLGVIENIARRARASLSAAAWRYCDVTEERCAVVWSTEGTIHWSKRSRGFPFFLPKSRPVEKGTFAAACFAGKKVPGRPQVVPVHLWASSMTVDPSIRMLEQSKALPSYRSVISLLWFDS